MGGNIVVLDDSGGREVFAFETPRVEERGSGGGRKLRGGKVEMEGKRGTRDEGRRGGV